jgi:predicted flap endonuclease-1-like 5' DNA nuclease
MTVRERLSSDNETRDGGWDDDTQWNERAAFRIAVESRDAGEGRLVWRTRAYHEEHDKRRVWTGVPDEAVIEWIHDQLRQSIGSAIPVLVRRPPDSAAPASPASEVTPDNLQQIPGIGPAIARRLHAAGITTFAALAACSPSDLAAWTGRSAEQINRMGWIERARELAYSTSSAPAPEQTPMEGPATEPAATLVEPVTEEAPPVETVIGEPLVVEAELAPAMPPEAPMLEALSEEAPPSAAEAELAPAISPEALPEEALPSTAEETGEVQDMMLEEAPIVFAAILLDEEGDVQDTRLSTTGDQPPEWNDQQVARCFIEPGMPIPDDAAPVALHLKNVQIETVSAQSGKGAVSRLRATASVHLEGAEVMREQSASCYMFLLAYDLAAGETHVLGKTRVDVMAGAADVPLTIDTDLPEVGRYQLLIAALIPEARALSAVSGPRLRVTP